MQVDVAEKLGSSYAEIIRGIQRDDGALHSHLKNQYLKNARCCSNPPYRIENWVPSARLTASFALVEIGAFETHASVTLVSSQKMAGVPL